MTQSQHGREIVARHLRGLIQVWQGAALGALLGLLAGALLCVLLFLTGCGIFEGGPIPDYQVKHVTLCRVHPGANPDPPCWRDDCRIYRSGQVWCPSVDGPIPPAKSEEE